MGQIKNIKLHIVTDIKQPQAKHRTMTRWARGGQGKREHDASSWEDLKPLAKKHFSQKQNQDKGNVDRSTGGQKDKIGKPVSEKLEKQRAARRLRRKKGKPCFHCRKPGHKSSECPLKAEGESSDLCFKCGSTEHTVHQCSAEMKEGESAYPFARCFICKQNGHLSGNCPENPRGLYPDGGGCKFCGSVEHYKRDCPEKNGETKESNSSKRKYKLREENESIDAIVDSEDENEGGLVVEQNIKKRKVIKF